MAVAPQLLVPRLGLQRSILAGLLIFAAGLSGAGLSPSPGGFIGSIVVVSIGCVCIPALQAFLANLAEPSERGAILGSLGSLTELTGAIGSTLYASILASFTSATPPLPLPGMHFFVGGAMLIVAWAVAARAFTEHADAARAASRDVS
uniref:Major facilitator superfamily (MFS) profile domain-containing protein n=1 Tax=Prymnesium polylepis TaxID=72548 RepID=A0A7S4JK29_9EUKA